MEDSSSDGTILTMDTLSAWDEFARVHQQDEQFTSIIKKIVDFGIFVGLEGGIDGLVHLGDISWSEPGETAIKRYAVGDEIEVTVPSINVDMQRISLGIKQCRPNPYTIFADNYEAGDQVAGRIREVRRKYLIVDLPGEVAGKVRLPNLSIGDPAEHYEPGDKIDLVILENTLQRGCIELGLRCAGDDPLTQEVRPDKPAPKPLVQVRKAAPVETLLPFRLTVSAHVLG